MSENHWTQDDFVQLARPKMMAVADSNALPNLLCEFFSEALLHYDDATYEGKAYIDKAMESLVAVFEASRLDKSEIFATSEFKSSRDTLEGIFMAWIVKREGFIRSLEPEGSS